MIQTIEHSKNTSEKEQLGKIALHFLYLVEIEMGNWEKVGVMD